MPILTERSCLWRSLIELFTVLCDIQHVVTLNVYHWLLVACLASLVLYEVVRYGDSFPLLHCSDNLLRNAK